MRYGTSKNTAAVEKMSFLLRREIEAADVNKELTPQEEVVKVERGSLAQQLYYADLKFSPALLLLASLVGAATLALLMASVISAYFIPVFIIAGAYVPFAYVASRKDKRAASFAEDYPTILMATASSMKVGMTPYVALERSVRLLSKNSIARKEVETLSSDLRSGQNVKSALSKFGDSIDLPELSLFRAAFLLVLENGGRFAPTLSRLANVSRDRDSLISSARVSTATMRMTANILLLAASAILLMVSLRDKDFWDLFINHPTANLFASIGIVLIGGSYAILRKMSNFRP